MPIRRVMAYHPDRNNSLHDDFRQRVEKRPEPSLLATPIPLPCSPPVSDLGLCASRYTQPVEDGSVAMPRALPIPPTPLLRPTATMSFDLPAWSLPSSASSIDGLGVQSIAQTPRPSHSRRAPSIDIITIDGWPLNDETEAALANQPSRYLQECRQALKQRLDRTKEMPEPGAAGEAFRRTRPERTVDPHLSPVLKARIKKDIKWSQLKSNYCRVTQRLEVATRQVEALLEQNDKLVKALAREKRRSRHVENRLWAEKNKLEADAVRGRLEVHTSPEQRGRT